MLAENGEETMADPCFRDGASFGDKGRNHGPGPRGRRADGAARHASSGMPGSGGEGGCGHDGNGDPALVLCEASASETSKNHGKCRQQPNALHVMLDGLTGKIPCPPARRAWRSTEPHSGPRICARSRFRFPIPARQAAVVDEANSADPELMQIVDATTTDLVELLDTLEAGHQERGPATSLPSPCRANTVNRVPPW